MLHGGNFIITCLDDKCLNCGGLKCVDGLLYLGVVLVSFVSLGHFSSASVIHHLVN